MDKVVAMAGATEWDGIGSIDGVPPLDAAQWNREGADMHLAVLDAHDRLRARCSLWWRKAPSVRGLKAGAIGHYRAADGAAAENLLGEACRLLGGRGCGVAVGPMDGNTWNSYRFVSKHGAAPAFFLEPENPESYPGHFARCQFRELARYCSSASPGAMAGDKRIERIARHLERSGIEFCTFDKTHPEEELRAIYRLSLVAFKDNFLFTRLTVEDFLSLYRPLLPLVPAEAIHLARYEGRLAGFAFAIPDMLQALRGERIDTLVLKSLARSPERMFMGLGGVLAARCERYAVQELGYKQIIHALMHVDNTSKSISGRFAQTIREYTLYAKVLS